MENRRVQIISPGRVNLLGEHVDKYDGIVLPAAIDRAITLTAESRSDSLLHLKATDLNEEVTIDLAQVEKKVDISGNPLPTWAQYPAGVAWSLQQGGFRLSGADCQFKSDIPIGAGLSSSAAVEVAFAVLWQELGGWPMDRPTLARFCQKAEVEYVGVNCGLMDQFACANGEKDCVVLLDTRNLDSRPIPLPMGTAIVIADSTVRHNLVTSAYNDRVNDCQMVLEIIQKKNPQVQSLRDVSHEMLESESALIPEGAYKHASHVVGEIRRVNTAIYCLEKGDVQAFGQLMFETHASLKDLYEVSCQELDQLVEIATRFDGCYGARLTGAGFGGCTVNLVEQSKAKEFADFVADEYYRRTGFKTPVFITHASPGAHVL
mgnify:CR=1 FL=1